MNRRVGLAVIGRAQTDAKVAPLLRRRLTAWKAVGETGAAAIGLGRVPVNAERRLEGERLTVNG
jgi:hypothetical protein